MLVLATILDNPGEPPAETRYRDLAELKRLGYTGLVAYQSSGLCGLMGPECIEDKEMRRWVGDLYEQVQQLSRQAGQAGLSLWLNYDAPALAQSLVGPTMSCVRQPQVLCPASDELLERSVRCLEDLLGRIESVEGVVLRLGDTDAHRLEYLAGNDLYGPRCGRCGGMGRAERLVRYVGAFYDCVVNRLGRRLIVRAWNVRPGGLHDDAALCRRVVGQLPQDDRLMLSFKFTQTDFWRYQRWNPSSLVCGDRPVLYELECQREYEGKGSLPNYQMPLWRSGMPEVKQAVGLGEVAGRVNLAGLWAWVRGGGWSGPYVSDETWIDMNVYAVPQLAADPQADSRAVARQWLTERLDCRDPAAAEAMMAVIEHSPQTVLEMFYIGAYARNRSDPWYPSGDFIQDDLVDVEAGWSLVRRLGPEALEEAVAEKQRAVERLAADRRLLAGCAAALGAPYNETLLPSLKYAQTLAQATGALLEGLMRYRRWKEQADGQQARSAAQAIRRCQDYWNQHQHTATLPGTATAFRSENLWDWTQRLLEELNG